MKIYLAQMKPILGDINKNLEQMILHIKKGIEEEAQLVIFPELSLTGYLLEELVADVAIEKVPKELLELSKKVSIIFGAVESGADRYLYNSAFYIEDGELVHTHRKVYLPTYGMFDEGRYFKSGDKIRAFDTKFGRIGILICEDAWHQTSPFILAQDGATRVFILVNSPARAFKTEFGIEKEWDSICHSAAITNNIFVTMVNRVGVEDGVSFWGGSKIFAPTGDILGKCELFEEGSFLGELKETELRRARISSPVSKTENIPLVLKELSRIWEN